MSGNGSNGRARQRSGSGHVGRKQKSQSRYLMTASAHDLEPEALLPLTEPAFHILLALSERELHGYGIIIAVENATRGAVRLRTGTLYTAIGRMVEDGLIQETEGLPGEGDDGRRRYYRLTRFGRAVARAEALRLQKLTALARSHGLLRPRRRRR